MIDAETRALVARASGQIDARSIADLAGELLARPSPAGEEAALAQWLAAWVADRSGLAVRLEGSNLLLGPDDPAVALYGHLDTSLSGDPSADGPLTLQPDRPPPPARRDGVLWGQGAGVAKAPTAAAVVACLAAARALGDGSRVGMLVAAGGTHRAWPPWPARTEGAPPHDEAAMGVGVRTAVGGGWAPGAVIVAKGGAPGPLHEEPGSLYLAVTVEDRYGAVLGRPRTAGLTGAPALVPAVLEAVATWRTGFLAARADRPAGSQAGADVAVGALSAGLPAKPDLLPARADLYLYVVTVPGDTGPGVGADLAAHLRRSLPDIPTAVTLFGELPPGRTDPGHPLARIVRDLWAERFGPVDVRDWRGSTDGALLRSLGIPTVRVGPPLLSAADDPRVEGVEVDALLALARLWAAAMIRYSRSG